MIIDSIVTCMSVIIILLPPVAGWFRASALKLRDHDFEPNPGSNSGEIDQSKYTSASAISIA